MKPNYINIITAGSQFYFSESVIYFEFFSIVELGENLTKAYALPTPIIKAGTWRHEEASIQSQDRSQGEGAQPPAPTPAPPSSNRCQNFYREAK